HCQHKILYYDSLQLTDVRLREQRTPPPAIAGFNRAPGPPKDRSPIAKVDPDGALVSLKEMPIPPVESNHDIGEVACRKIGGLSVRRAPLINHFQRRQNSALLGIVGLDGLICKPCRNRPHGHDSFLCIEPLASSSTRRASYESQIGDSPFGSIHSGC